MVNNTMRAAYRELTDEEKKVVAAIKQKGEDLHDILSSLSPSREVSLALTKLEESIMWAVKHVTK